MAIRQYIGARYVPRFVGTYDVTQVYDALDVVDNGSGTSYIARKTVPAGTPLTNNEYWFVYGSSSGAIINLQGQIDAIVNTDLPGIQNNINVLDNNIQNKIIPFNFTGKILVISDSYGLNKTSDTNETFVDIASNLLDVSMDLESISSGSFGSGSPYLIEGLENYAGDKNEIELILVMAGANDCSTVNGSFSNIISGINNFNTYARANYPNAKVALMPCGTNYANLTGINADGRLQMLEGYMTGARNNGWIFAENSQYVLHDTRRLKSDLIHPSDSGIRAIGYAMVQFLVSGVVTFYNRMIHNAFDSIGSNITSGLIHCDSLFIDNDLMWYKNTTNSIISVTLTNAVSVTGGATNWIDIGKLSERMFDTFSTSNKWLISSMGMCADTSNNWYMCAINFSMQHGELYCEIFTSAPNIKTFRTVNDCIPIPKM